jgi:cytochrome c oxidase subunit II
MIKFSRFFNNSLNAFTSLMNLPPPFIRSIGGISSSLCFFGKCSNFQFPATDVMMGVINLHAYIMSFLFFVFIFVFWLFANILFEFFYKPHNPRSKYDFKYIFIGLSNRVPTHNLIIELIWTILPSFILVAIAVPSFSLLYLMSDLTIVQNYIVFVQCVGKQWYWEYFTYVGQISTAENTQPIPHHWVSPMDSYMIPTNELELGKPRLLTVDHPLIVPVQTDLLLGITATDVLHSWTVPSFGVKMDAIPGHLNRVKVNVKRTGVYYGQCSELCGVNHGFMPIEVRVVDPETFFSIQLFILCFLIF